MANSNDNGRLSAVELARAAMTALAELPGYDPEAATALEWDGDSDTWRVTVDVLELQRVPNTTDVIGAYEVRLDPGGTLHGYKRLRRFTRAESREED
jgi:Gas vesicle synthesis protein GvpO